MFKTNVELESNMQTYMDGTTEFRAGALGEEHDRSRTGSAGGYQ